MSSRKITVKECEELLDLSSMYIHKMMLSSNSCSQSFAEFLNNNFTATDFVFTNDSGEKLIQALTEAHKKRISHGPFQNREEMFQFMTDMLNENYFI